MWRSNPVVKPNLISKIMSTLLVLMAAVVFYFAYLLLWPQTPFRVKGTTILTPTVSMHDGTVKYTLSYCKYTDNIATVYRQLVPTSTLGAPYGFPAIEGIAKPGCHTQTILLPLPTGVQPGIYYIHGDLNYPINAIRSVHVYYDTPTFEVVP